MVAVYSAGAKGVLRVRKVAGEEGDLDVEDEYASFVIEPGDLYILHGNQYMHSARSLGGRRGVLVIPLPIALWPMASSAPTSMGDKLIPDVPPDYANSIPVVKREKFKRDYQAWRAKIMPGLRKQKLESEEQKFKLKVRTLNDEDLGQLAAWVDRVEADTTFGSKVYAKFERVSQGCPQLGAEFAAVADVMQKIVDEKLPKQRMLPMKNHHIALLSYGPNVKRDWDFKPQQRKNQLHHLDAPAVVKGLPKGVVAFQSGFVTMTKHRAATRHAFDLDLEELLEGKTWGEDEETNEWILWRLYFAHMLAFEMHAEQDEEAAKSGDWEVSEAGWGELFDPRRRWHAGMEGLRESTLPEVVLLLQYAYEPIAEYFDKYLNVTGGFGQHPWTYATACEQLKEVQAHSFVFSRVSLSMMASENTHPPTGFFSHVRCSRRRTFCISSEVRRRRSQFDRYGERFGVPYPCACFKNAPAQDWSMCAIENRSQETSGYYFGSLSR